MLAMLFSALVFVTVVMIQGPMQESEHAPVITNWTPLAVVVEGDDVIISGMMVKSRGCSYLPPPRARSSDGRVFPVISTAPLPGFSWAPSPTPQQFGPWRVVGARGYRLELYQEHRCHIFWPTFTVLGSIVTK
jgi:hypothetical protein